MYNVNSDRADEFICHEKIESVLNYSAENCGDVLLLRKIMEKAKKAEGLTCAEAMLLLDSDCAEINAEIFKTAGEIKNRFYGNRIVMFAPLYLSNYCVNSCRYCPYHAKNKDVPRIKLTREQIVAEVNALSDTGHKRLALEAGEDDKNCPIEYILEAIKTVYSVKNKNGAIRRVNVNIAATSVENYARLKAADIGTYILFQETYHKETYEYLHPKGPKSDYAYHTEAMDRAMEGGIDDVGLGVLFGLNLYRYDFAGLLMHKEHLEAKFGVGPHTVSVPRICPASDVNASEYDNAVSDGIFKKIVAVLRIAVPYTGLIVSTRESEKVREEVIKIGVSQISGGSRTSVGGYTLETPDKDSAQFEVSDTRSLKEVVKWLMKNGHIPSFCTACYREGRVGDRFMRLVKAGQIANVCAPNALMTLTEYAVDYGDNELKAAVKTAVAQGLKNIKSDKVREKVRENIELIYSGKRDFRL